jgi:hypothetical protein
MEFVCENLYSGCKGISQQQGIEYISATNTTAEKFFDKYVKTRTPVAFTDQIVDAKCTVSASNLWSNDYLLDKCQNCSIKKEVRQDDESGRYGLGSEEQTTFAEFMETFYQGNSYLTTQDLEYDADGRPAIVSPPLTSLTSDFPLTPELFKNLVVNNVNMWFGYTKPGAPASTSGLHHDFHDNLYILLRGEKHFTLYSPAEANNMYTVGNIQKIHPNGRINYHGQLPTRADGSDTQAEVALAASARLQKLAAKLEKVFGK